MCHFRNLSTFIKFHLLRWIPQRLCTETKFSLIPLCLACWPFHHSCSGLWWVSETLLAIYTSGQFLTGEFPFQLSQSSLCPKNTYCTVPYLLPLTLQSLSLPPFLAVQTGFFLFYRFNSCLFYANALFSSWSLSWLLQLEEIFLTPDVLSLKNCSTRHLMKCALKALYCDYLFACFISLWLKVVLPIFVFAKVVSTKWRNKYEMPVQIGALTTLLTINNKRNRTDSEKEVIISKRKLGRISER